MNNTPRQKSAGKRRRTQQPVILQFRSDIPPNEHHPLADVEPNTRALQRQTVIASILARLAEAQSDAIDQNVTMSLTDIVALKETCDQPEE